MLRRVFGISVICLAILLIMPLSTVWAHEDVGEKQRDDRVYMSITNDSPNQRTDVTFYYIEFSHPGHDHDWLAPTGVGGCDLGTINPGASATCHSPWHSSKSPDGKPECDPVSDYNFRFMISYNEGGTNKNSAQTNAAVTSVVADSGTVSGFKWDAHIDQKFLEEPCTLAPPPPEDSTGVAPEEDDGENIVLPDWFKNNAIWWRDGKITDVDIINAIESLISLGIIPLEAFATLPAGEGGTIVEVTKERTIPDYIKELFGWWADGLVPDSDIANALGFLISAGIISSENIQKEINENGSSSSQLDVGSSFDAEFIKKLYVENKWNELTANWLLEIKNAENNLFDEAADQVWKEYSDNQNPDLMQQATLYETAEKKSKGQVSDSLDVLHEINDFENSIIKIAENNGISKLELENEAETPQNEIDNDIKKLKDSSEISYGYENAQNAHQESSAIKNEIEDDFLPGLDGPLVDEQEDIFKKIAEILFDENTVALDDSPVSILTGYITGSVDIQPLDDEWNSGEEIPVTVYDHNYNQNNRADEDFDLSDPDVSHIPTLQTGNPHTLDGLTVADLPGHRGLPIDTIQPVSDRAILVVDDDVTLVDGDSLDLTFGTMEDFFDAAPINDDDFHGFALFNYDIRSLTDNVSGIESFDIILAGQPIAKGANPQDLILLDYEIFRDLDGTTPLTVEFEINDVNSSGLGTLNSGETLPIVADVFGFGFLNDGLEGGERIANQIIRLELEETDGNTGLFEGSLEYTMINQLNVLDPSTYDDLSTIDDEATFIVIEDLTDEDAPRVNYLEIIDDGIPTKRADQQEAPTHSGIVSFDLDTYKVADTVIITLQDLDLNIDSDLIDIYTTVSGSPETTLNDVVGDDDFNFTLSDGDELGRLLDVTFDDELWTAENNDTCRDLLLEDGIDTGLAATGFTLIETDRDSGEFLGDFEIPSKWCRGNDSSPETTTGLDLEVNYVDFRDASGEIIEVGGGSAGILTSTSSLPDDSGIPDPNDSSTSPPSVPEIEYFAYVYVFDFAEYPVAQFTKWRWPGECGDQWHVHTQTGHAVNLGLTGMGDPDPNDCGWGKTSELTPHQIVITGSELKAFSDKTGFNPLLTEPMLGGDGFSPPP